MSYKIKKSYGQGLTSRSIILPRSFLAKYEITDKVKITLCEDYIAIKKAYDNDFWKMGMAYKSVIDENGNYYRHLTTLTSGSQSVTIPKHMLTKLGISNEDWIKISCIDGLSIRKAKHEEVLPNES